MTEKTAAPPTLAFRDQKIGDETDRNVNFSKVRKESCVRAKTYSKKSLGWVEIVKINQSVWTITESSIVSYLIDGQSPQQILLTSITGIITNFEASATTPNFNVPYLRRPNPQLEINQVFSDMDKIIAVLKQ